MIENKITSIVLRWYNHTEHCEEELSCATTKILRKSKKLVYEEFSELEKIRRVEIQLSPSEVELFFKFMGEIFQIVTSKNDYRLPVYDGSAWELCFYSSSVLLSKCKGTTAYPFGGEEIESKLLMFFKTTKIEKPRLFGCV